MREKRTHKTILLVLLVLSAVIIILSIALLASVPPVDRDALTHHLFVLKLYLQHGSIYEIPEIIFSYYPMNLDLLYMIPLSFGNDIIPKYIHFCFSLLTCSLLYRYVKPRLGTHWAIFTALFFMSIPVIVKLSITVYVDLGLIFFSTASLLSLIVWANSRFAWQYLVLSGLCAGLAAGTKYNGLVTVAVLTLLCPLVYSRISSGVSTSQWTHSLKTMAVTLLFLTATLLTYSPWMVRNISWTGNPIYPLHDRLFNRPDVSSPQQVHSNQASGEERQRTPTNVFVTRRVVFGETAWQTLTLPIRFFFQGQDDNPKYFDGKLNPFLLILPLFAFIGLRGSETRYRHEIYILGSFAFLYFFFTFFQSAMRVRYISPSLPPLVMLSVYGMDNIYKLLKNRIGLSKKKASVSILAIGLGVLLYQGIYIHQLFPTVRPFDYLTGALSRDAYITAYRPEYPAIQWLNERTTSDDLVLCIFLGNRGYYMDFFPIFADPYRDMLVQDVNKYSYILIRDDMFSDWLNYTKRNDISILLQFNDIDPVFSSHGHSVYHIE